MSNSIFTSHDFKKEVLNLSLNLNTSSRCADQWVGDVELKSTGFQYLSASDNKFSRRKNLDDMPTTMPINRLIIVLESPHVDEFEFCDNFQAHSAIGPANGKTGVNIRNFLQNATQEFSALNFAELNDRFALILMNSIQYQCSLGNQLNNTPSRRNRDMVFRACWVRAKQDFCERLSRYLTERTLVINACVKGQNKGGYGGRWLRDLVEDAILCCNVPDDRYVRRCHPSSLPNWKTGKTWNPQTV